ncbi:hypothetical protein GcC1_047022 [Golovinomyces cichoracearum]|uniref:Uncharacterized protein n=1 Tax=Golovinomyces cichoracearum TaxID=62708 RepID=A0A420IXW4_9PEZI|nr:hypothetical protein GcC1_047022 [Golovinomyces cichoracearum]
MSHQDWTDNLRDDAGWNRPYVDESSLISKKYQALITSLIGKSLVCTSNGNVYIFLPILNKWSVLYSDDATISLNSLMEMGSASVNYDKAFRPYVSFIERSSLDNIASLTPTSVCVGTNRLRVSRLGETLELVPCEPVLVQHPSYSKSSPIASLCYMPLSMKIIHRTCERTDNLGMYRSISPLSPNNTQLLTIEWAIGNDLVDPVSASKAVFLREEGRTGKTTLLTPVKKSLAGCCGSIPDRSLLGISKGMTNAVASIVVWARSSVDPEI